jgi:DNA mismatch repair protein MSH6
VQVLWTFKCSCTLLTPLHVPGKFYELYHMDADIGVQVCNLIYMKGHIAHSGFPEISYGSYADKLVRAGYKVARVEQTETPSQLQERKKQSKGKKVPKVVNREVCSIMTIGTRTFCYLDMSETQNPDRGQTDSNPDRGTGKLLAIKEVMLGSSPQRSDTDTDGVPPTCEYGITLVDAVRGSVTIGQFEDDVLRSRMLTLLTTFSPVEVSLCDIYFQRHTDP